nr:PREDICTED: uncharacterized protein LOC107825783 [Nicotiana tabacum]
MFLSEFDIVYVTQKAINGQSLADHLAENPIDKDYEPLTTYFPNEVVLFAGEDIAGSYPGWRMFFDGTAKLKGAWIRVVLIFESGQHYPTLAKIRLPCTNNMAEYEACILGIRMAVNTNIKELLVTGDFDLLIHQVQDEDPDGKPWYYDIKRFLEVKASTYKAVTKKVLEDFVRNNIVCRFGIPESLITDNAANINSDLMKEICENFRIIHRNSIAYKLQMNGAVEASNKNIKRILRKIVDNHRQWHDKLSFALLGYRTTMRTSSGKTPYMLVYGTEIVILVEVEIPSLRVIQEAKLYDA